MLLYIRALAVYFIVAYSYQCQAEPIRLVIPQFPPYTSEAEGKFSGIGVDMLRELMEELAVDYRLRAVPNYARALEELINGQADGFFLASENAQRNSVATFSEPLMQNRWSWFLAKDSNWDTKSELFKGQAKVASLRGSNTHAWLSKMGYNVITVSNNASHFPKMLLQLKRIDSVFLAEKVFKDELQKQGYSEGDYRQIVQVSQPFGIYISNAYIAKHPEFMETLNQAIINLQKNIFAH